MTKTLYYGRPSNLQSNYSKTSREIDDLLQSDDLNEEEKEEMEYIWNNLKSREESKFDAIINVIKDCDKQIQLTAKERLMN